MTSTEKTAKPRKKTPTLTATEITKLKQLLSNDEKFNTLLELADKYDYVSDYIFEESKDISVRDTDETPDKTTTVKMYQSTFDEWQKYTQKHHSIKASKLLDLALIEFMKRHP